MPTHTKTPSTQSAARKLYQAPIVMRYNYGWDARNRMVFCRDEERWIPRGWGHVQYLRNGAALYDAWTEEFEALVRDDMTADEVCAVLNRALSS